MTATWLGWSSRAGAPESGWIELSRVLVGDMPRIASFPAPRIERIRAMPDDPFDLTELQMVVHVGTHLDAPSHFIPGGPTIDEVPLDRFHGPGVVWHVPELGPYGTIEVDHLEAARPEARPDDIVLLDTGSARHFGTAAYDQHPSLSTEAARWLVRQRIKLVGLDTPTPDLAAARRPPGFDWPVHHILLRHGVLIGEHLDSVADLAGRRVEVWFLPLRLAGADGAPARVIARPWR